MRGDFFRPAREFTKRIRTFFVVRLFSDLMELFACTYSSVSCSVSLYYFFRSFRLHFQHARLPTITALLEAIIDYITSRQF
jgi:hypothetical protein